MISKETEIPESFIPKLVNWVDISQLACLRGKPTKHLCGRGYDSVDKIAKADLGKMKEDMKSYFDKIGERLSESFFLL